MVSVSFDVSISFSFHPFRTYLISSNTVDGQCNLAQKDAAVDKITNDPKTTVILISIKSGAVGLNLTMCSRVILLDLWFNPQIENQ